MNAYKNKIKPLAIFSLPVLLLIFLNICACRKQEYGNFQPTQPQSYNTPQFTKEGELTFVSKTKQEITTIDIEISNTPESREMGLMYRRTMNNTQGMLFVYDTLPTRFSWMKNTYIPLDMIFVDKKKKIVQIVKHTTPFSEELIPIPKETKYKIEVTAGFSNKYGISIGDYITIKPF
jgi:hypothetical protein